MRLKIFILVILCFSLNSCADLAIKRKFERVVFFNGINEYEALAIANMQIRESSYKPYLKTTEPNILTNTQTLEYPGYWFIDFTQPYLFDAPSYLVIIEKETGDVKFADSYYPRKNPDSYTDLAQTLNLTINTQ